MYLLDFGDVPYNGYVIKAPCVGFSHFRLLFEKQTLDGASY